MISFSPRREHLDQILARPHLWPGEVEAAQTLAAELGVPLIIWRLDLNNQAAGWQPITDHEQPA